MSYAPETSRMILESAEHVFVGRAGSTPSIKYLDSGKTVASFRLAVSNGRDADAHWFTVEAWDELAQQVADDLDKGGFVRITGRVVEKAYKTRAGEDRTDVLIKPNSIEVLNAAKKPQPAAAPAEELPF